MSTVLFVHAKGGPPLGYALSRVAARSAVHLLALSTIPPTVAPAVERLCHSVRGPAETERDDLVSLIVSRAEAVGADAVVTFSEYAVVAVAEACAKLGLAGSRRLQRARARQAAHAPDLDAAGHLPAAVSPGGRRAGTP